MAEIEVANHTYELLKRVSAKIDNQGLELGDIKLRFSAVEDHLSGLTVSMAGLTHRVDRVERRLDRIERRLDLHDGTEDAR